MVSKRSVSPALKMSAEIGVTGPLGFFDPLSLSKDLDPVVLKKYSEAELKHGRVAMLSVLGMIVNENTNLFFDGKITGPAIYQFQQADEIVPFFWELVLFSIALVEGQNIVNGWESVKETKARGPAAIAGLKEDYINGDLGFDPLGLSPKSEEEFAVMRTKEINNGRLAMIGVAGAVAQELITGNAIFHI